MEIIIVYLNLLLNFIPFLQSLYKPRLTLNPTHISPIYVYTYINGLKSLMIWLLLTLLLHNEAHNPPIMCVLSYVLLLLSLSLSRPHPTPLSEHGPGPAHTPW